ncbi:MAG: toll/interleukin-1 receptor domain-containing protein [Oscillospiraceae bacterium]|nr:toll/interleukin-1 receptor domain-containing protein [Oscillospiraceae bacterium]
MKDIFISHADKDKKVISLFIDLILSNGLNIDTGSKVFCTSADGTKIKSGEDWRNEIKDNILSAKISFLVISPNYKESEICMNEMGAIWISEARVIPLIIEPINYKTVGVLHEPTQIEKLLDGKSLDRIKDVLQEMFKIPAKQIKSDNWSAKKEEFIARTRKHLENNPFNIPMDRNNFESCMEENKKLKNNIVTISEENSKLSEIIKELEKAKDSKEVSKIKTKHSPKNEYDDFEQLAYKIRKCFEDLPSIIVAIIFKDFSGKDNIEINGNSYRNAISNAIANDYIFDDDDYTPNWSEAPLMIDIRDCLNEISNIVKQNQKNSNFVDKFEENYPNVPLKIDNKIFWEKVFSCSMYFE